MRGSIRPAFIRIICVGAMVLVGAFPLRLAYAQAAGAQSGDPLRGAMLYSSCTGCHSLDENDIGPLHRGVVGRKAGVVQGYVYSAALKTSGIVWTAEGLDRWLANPQKMVKGAKMYFSVAKAQDRADIIAYLAQQK